MAVNQESQVFLFLSQILGKKIVDTAGRPLGVLADLVVNPAESYPLVTDILVSSRRNAPPMLIPWERVADCNGRLTVRPGEAGSLPARALAENELLLRDALLDKQIVDTDLNDLKATILQDDTFAKAAAGSVDPETTNKVLIPKIIRERYPDLDESQVEELRQQVVVDSVIKNGEVREVGDKRFIKMAEKFVNIDDITINLIDSVNPFQRAFEVMSKSVTPSVLRIISDAITATRVVVSEDEALTAWPKIQAWAKVNGRKPDVRSDDPIEKRHAEILLFLQRKKQQRLATQRAAEIGVDEP